MSAAAQPTGRMRTALREAVIAAAAMAALSFPVMLLRTESDEGNRLVLQVRLAWLLVPVAAGFFGRLALALIRPSLSRPKPITAELKRGNVRAKNTAWAVFGAVALAAYPIFILMTLGPQGALKWVDNYGIQILIYVMLGWGLNIVVGLAGLLDLGYVAFYAVGAYTYALLATTFGLSFWLCLPLAGLFAALWGVILGFPVLRLRGDYLAIVTLAFGEIIRIVLVNWSVVTNGDAGIASIPRITFFGLPFIAGETGFAAFFGLKFSPIHRVIFLYYLILVLALFTNAATLRLRKLPIGRAWEALREDEIACRSLGINTTKTKLTAFAIGAMFGGFAGAFFAVRQGFVSPSSFTFIESATILAVVVLGGRGSQIGVALAAFAIVGLSEILRELEVLKVIFGNDFDPTQYRMLLVGFAMVLMMNIRPRGFVSSRTPSVALGDDARISGALISEGRG